MCNKANLSSIGIDAKDFNKYFVKEKMLGVVGFVLFLLWYYYFYAAAKRKSRYFRIVKGSLKKTLPNNGIVPLKMGWGSISLVWNLMEGEGLKKNSKFGINPLF